MSNDWVLVPKNDLDVIRSVISNNDAILTASDLLTHVAQDYNGGLGDGGYSVTPVHFREWHNPYGSDYYGYNSIKNFGAKIIYLSYNSDGEIVLSVREAEEFYGDVSLYLPKNSFIIFERGSLFSSDLIGTQLKFQNSDLVSFIPQHYAGGTADMVMVGAETMMITLPDLDENAPTSL